MTSTTDFTLTVLSQFDSWRASHFTSSELSDSSISGPNADPDHDGLSNLVEYALGSVPKTTSLMATPQVNVNNGRITITFTHNTAATDVTLSVLGTDNLIAGPWTELARSTGGAAFTVIASGATVSESGTGSARSVQVGDVYLTNDHAHPKRFLKLQVKQ